MRLGIVPHRVKRSPPAGRRGKNQLAFISCHDVYWPTHAIEPPPETGKHPWWCLLRISLFPFPGHGRPIFFQVSVIKWSMFIVYGPSIGLELAEASKPLGGGLHAER